MVRQARAWKLLKSFKMAFIVGGMAGLVVMGLTYDQFVGHLEPQQSLLAGAGVLVGLTLIFTYVFDQVAQSVGSFREAAKGKTRKDNERRP